MKNIRTGLVVEDNLSVTRALQDYLRQIFPAIALWQAVSLAEARAILSGNTPDLVLLDIGLPDGKGIQLLTEGHINPASHVIIITIFDDDEHIFEALRAGAQGYLLKDETDEQFIAALTGILSGRPPLSPAVARRIMAFFRPEISVQNTGLSPREVELLILIANGKSVRVAAEALGVTHNTAAGYLKNIYQKLQVNCRAEVTRKAIDLGLLGNVQ